LPDALTKPSDELYIYNLLYALEFRCDIYNSDIYNSTGEHIYSKIHSNIKSDGNFHIWDCLAGTEYNGSNVPTGRKYFKMKYTISYCKSAANFVGKEHNFSVNYVYEKSLPEAPEEPENTTPLLSPTNENTVFQNKNAPPNFSIIPNPNSGTFQLETNFSLSEISNLKISNLIGTPIYETQHVTEQPIQLPNSASGMLFVVIMLKDGAVLTQKMVVQ
jgi:hypothetical protein